MKKGMTVILSAVMILCFLSSCGSKNNTTDTTSTTQTATSAENKIQNTTQPLTENPSETPSDNHLLKPVLDNIFKTSQYSGVVYIADGENVLYESGFGKSNKEKNRDNNADTVFCIASNSKQFTATAIMLLQENGKLSVNDTISQYFPDYQYADTITIHHLLCMRSGIKDYSTYTDDDGNRIFLTEDRIEFEISEKATAKENRQSIEQWIFNQELNFSPDERFEYSNSNYMLLAEIVEQVSGMPYEEYIRQNIFEPLNMNSTSFIDLYDKQSENFAEQTSVEYGVEYLNDKGVSFGAGDIVSTAKDIGIWLNAVRNHSVVSENSLQLMTTNYSNENDTLPYGYGYMIEEHGFYHTGRIGSYSSVCYVSTVKEYNLIFMSNAPSGKIETLAGRINNELLSMN